MVCLAFLSCGNLFRFAASPFIVPWMGLYIWWLIASVVGIYPGRSIPYIVTGYGLRIQVLPFVICGIVAEFASVRKAMTGVALGLALVLFLCFHSGQMQEGRFFLPETSLANGNDLAMHIVLFGSLALSLLNGGRVSRILVIGAMPVALYYVLKTGSRSNMLTVILLAALSFLILPTRSKVIIAVLGVFLPVVLVPFLPPETSSRLTSFFSASADASTGAHQALLNAYAVDSTNARLELQRRAIELTEQHLLFGIGPQNFEDAVDEMIKQRGGAKSGWQVAHNSYLEVSAETGLPGLLFYAWNILLCLKLNFAVFWRFRADKENAAAFLVTFSLFMATCAYAFGILFCTIPYDFHLALLVGLTASIHLFFKGRLSPAIAPAAPGRRPEARRATD